MWTDDFIKLLFSNDQTKINTTKAAELKYQNFPSFLYRYRTFDDKSLKSLKDDKIFLSSPLQFNDPYDCAVMIKEAYYVNNDIVRKSAEDNPKKFRKAHNITDKQLSKIKKSPDFIKELSTYIARNGYPQFKNNPKKLIEISRTVEKEIREITADFNALKEYLFVSCFSEDPKSILMWSHYANEHTGFCVEYDFKSLGPNSHLTRLLFPVIYTDKIFIIDDYVYNTIPSFINVLSSYLSGIDLNEVLESTKLELLEGDSKSNNMFQFLAALNKFVGWEYEQEWRYVIYCQNESDSAYIRVPKPNAVYLGAMVEEKNKDAILKIGKDRNIDVYQMQLKSSEYALNPKKIL